MSGNSSSKPWLVWDGEGRHMWPNISEMQPRQDASFSRSPKHFRASARTDTTASSPPREEKPVAM